MAVIKEKPQYHNFLYCCSSVTQQKCSQCENTSNKGVDLRYCLHVWCERDLRQYKNDTELLEI